MKKFLLVQCMIFAAGIAGINAQIISIPKPVYTYKQNFDSMASSGSSSTLPNGWYLYETGSLANSSYSADSGASSTGDTYSYGHKGSSDRALGALATGSLTSYIGAEFKNNTGYSINSITVSYTIEQWRLGANGRSDSMTADITTFATNLASGFWVSLPLLNIKSPVTSGTTGQLDGNKAANRKKFTLTLSGISISNGSSIWIRWVDQNISGANDGLAIDDFSMSVKAYIPHTIRSSKFPQVSGIPDTTKTGLWTGVVLSPNFSATGLNFCLKDSTGSISAINLLNNFGYIPAVGDSVAVYGQIKSSNYLTYIAVDSVGLINSGNVTGLVKFAANINNDTLESGLVKINNLNLAPGYKWDTTGASKNGGFMTTVSNGVNTYNVWINKNTNIFNRVPPKFPFNLIGIVLQNSNSTSSGYYICPRFAKDFDTIPLPLYKISQVKSQNALSGVADSANTGHLVLLKGRVYSPDFTNPDLRFSLIDNTAAITVISTTVTNYTPALGDSVVVRGYITQSQGLTEITADSVRTLKKSTALLNAPKIITKLDETTESDLIEFKNARIVDSTKWIPAGNGFTVKYTNGTDTIDVYIFSNTDLFKLKSAPAGKFNLTGIGTQSKSSAPFIGSYQLCPRGLTDFEKILPFAPVPLYKISDLKGYNSSTGIADSLNKGKGFIKGVVHSKSFSAGELSFSFIDQSGAITIYSNTIKYYTPFIGDSLLIKGSVTQTAGLTEYAADSIILLTKGTWMRTPNVVTVLNENTESDLVKILNVKLTDTSQWKPAGSGFDVKISNGKDTFTMRISSTVDLFKMKALIGRFNITGIASQDQGSSPYFGSYLMQPRGAFDFEHVTELYKIREVRGQNGITGLADSAAGVNAFYLKGIVQSPDFILSGLDFSVKDSTGAIFINAGSKLNGYSAKTGDSVFVRGLLRQVNGLTVVLADSVSKLNPGSLVLTANAINHLDESTEAYLVKFNNAWLTDPTQWTNSGTSFKVKVTNGKDTISVLISNATDLFGKPALKGRFNITGIGAQNMNGPSLIGGYYLMPRGFADVHFLPYKLYNIAQIKGYNKTSGIADSVNVYCRLRGVLISQNLSGKGAEFFAIKDNTGAITVTAQKITSGYTPIETDSVDVRGTVHQRNGLTLFDMDSVSRFGKGVANVPVVVLKPDENTESGLIEAQAFKLADSTKWDTTGKNGAIMYLTAVSSKDTIQIGIMNGTDLYSNSSRPHGYFDVTGIGSQEDINAPYFSGYFLIPRSSADFSHSTGIEYVSGQERMLKIYPNPSSGILNIVSDYEMNRVEILNSVGQQVMTVNNAGSVSKVDLNELAKGLYFVRIYGTDMFVVREIVKE
jgi:hypothetical protein